MGFKETSLGFCLAISLALALSATAADSVRIDPTVCGPTSLLTGVVADKADSIKVSINFNPVTPANVVLQADRTFQLKFDTPLSAGNGVQLTPVAGGTDGTPYVFNVPACKVPPSVDPVNAGVNKVTGIVHDNSKFVTVCAVADIDECRKKPVQKDADDTDHLKSAAVGTDRKFTILRKDAAKKDIPFQENESYVAVEDSGLESKIFKIDSGKVEAKILTDVAEGGKIVSGLAKGAARVLVEVSNGHGSTSGLSQVKDVSLTDKDAGTFDAVLDKILVENEMVRVIPEDENRKPIGTPVSKDVRSSEYDWGRVRAYFSLGASSSKDDESFKSFHPYIALNIDYNWGTWKRGYDVGKCPPKAADPCGTQSANWYFKPNTYFEGRVTNTSSTAFGGALSNATLKSSARTETIELGFYMPINHRTMSWHFNNKRQVLFFAPIVKGGFQSVPQVSKTDNPVLVTDPANVYKFVSGGVRIGHYYQPKHEYEVAPELISFLDITSGRWDNLKDRNTALFSDGKGPNKTNTCSDPVAGTVVDIRCYHVPNRLELKGRMRIPVTPFTIGFRTVVGPGPDVMEIFLGTRIDLAPFLQKLVPAIGK